MLFRSVLFTVLFNLGTFVMLIFWTPVFFLMSRANGWKVVRVWALYSLWLQNWLIGTKFDFRGLEHLKHEDGLIVAAKHQSTWETYAMLLFLKDPSYVLKHELILLPFFGWFAMKMRMIAVKRGQRGKALKSMASQAREQCAIGRQIIIYPEGTRKSVDAPADYRYGIVHMYQEIGSPVIPMALNSGLFWPRRGLRLYPGTCVLEFLPVIQPGLEPEVFAENLHNVIEEKTAELVSEARNDPEYSASQ